MQGISSTQATITYNADGVGATVPVRMGLLVGGLLIELAIISSQSTNSLLCHECIGFMRMPLTRFTLKIAGLFL